jgi:hypothetical protein
MRRAGGRRTDRPRILWQRLRHTLRPLRRPSYRWLRIPLGVLLVLGGLLGFLPVLGFWMIPLGLWLLAVDFLPVRRFNRWLGARLGLGRRNPPEGPADRAGGSRDRG